VVIVHDPDYRAALQDFNSFIEKVSEKVIEADELIPELPVKDVVSYKARFPQMTCQKGNGIGLSHISRQVEIGL
jgi:hypothetical protein